MESTEQIYAFHGEDNHVAKCLAQVMRVRKAVQVTATRGKGKKGQSEKGNYSNLSNLSRRTHRWRRWVQGISTVCSRWGCFKSQIRQNGCLEQLFCKNRSGGYQKRSEANLPPIRSRMGGRVGRCSRRMLFPRGWDMAKRRKPNSSSSQTRMLVLYLSLSSW
jgi:hypothetical protein